MPKKFFKKPMISFQKKVYNVVRKIPRGKVLSYKEVARLAGRPRAFRAVGNVLGRNVNPAVHCHRVVRSDGSLGGYRYGQKRKARILAKEGVLIKNKKVLF